MSYLITGIGRESASIPAQYIASGVRDQIQPIRFPGLTTGLLDISPNGYGYRSAIARPLIHDASPSLLAVSARSIARGAAASECRQLGAVGPLRAKAVRSRPLERVDAGAVGPAARGVGDGRQLRERRDWHP